MKVFGIGLSKTGTKSLNAALRLIGFDVLHYPCDPVTAREVLLALPYSIVDRCDGLTDIHAAVCFRELDARYPGSRYILTLRDKVAWLDSCRRHLGRSRPERGPLLIGGMMVNLRLRAYGVARFDADAFSAAYDRHVGLVRNYFDGRNDLLQINIPGGEDWSALCPFLNRPVPDDPFPNIK